MVLQATLIAGFMISWMLVSASGLGFERLFPSPWRVLLEAIALLKEGTVLPHLSYSAYEVAWGFLIGGSLGMALGFVLGSQAFFGKVFEPMVFSVAPVPKIIIYPIFLWIFGIGTSSRVAMGALSTFFPMTLYAANAIRQVRPVHLDAARLLGSSPWGLYSKVYLPSMLPYLWEGLRLGVSISVIGILMAETKISQKGLGFLMIEHYNHFRIAEMYAVLLLIFCLVMGLNSLLGWIQGRVPVLRYSSQISGKL